jgi:ring-1,2-phenylacetyl-CoA epoxidase subunit PaaE
MLNDFAKAAFKLGEEARALANLQGSASIVVAELFRQGALWQDYAGVCSPKTQPVLNSDAIGALSPKSYLTSLRTHAASGDLGIAALAQTSIDRLAPHAEDLEGLDPESVANLPVPLRVLSVKPSGRDAAAITLQLPANAGGRFIGKAGQYITIHTEVAGIPLRRSYSLCRPPQWTADRQQIVIGVRAHTLGSVSTQLVTQSTPGEYLLVAPPTGALTHQCSARQSSNLLMVAVGSGITPLLALASDTLAAEPGCRIWLLVIERTAQDVMLPDILGELDADPRFRKTIVATRGPQAKGRPGRDQLETEITKLLGKRSASELSAAFLCGPTPMLQEISTACVAMGMDHASIQQETFQSDMVIDMSPRPGGAVQIDINGSTNTIEARPGETLLAAGLRTGVDIPYSCLAGSCGTCAVRITKGAAAPPAVSVLGEAKTKDGWVLSCMAAPAPVPEHVL